MRGLATRTLGEICDEGRGIVRTGPFGSQLHKSDYREHGIPVIMPKNIADGKVSTDGIARIDEEDARRLSQHKLKAGDIVYGRRGDIGRHAFIRPHEAGWLCGTGCLRISLGECSVDPLFLHYFLTQAAVTEWIRNQAIGATMPNLNTEILRSVPIVYPPLPAQRKIAAILSAYDDLIENNLRRIKILEEMAQLIYREWFVHYRFPGHEDVPMVDSLLGPIPEGWSVDTLGKVANIVMGQSPKSEFYNEDGVGLPFHQGVTDFGYLFPVTRRYCTATRRVAEPGDILFSVRAPVGRMNIADQRIVVGRGLSAIRSYDSRQAFLFCQLKAMFREEDMMGSGTIFKSVTKADMHGIGMLVPPNHVRDRFEVIARPLFAQLQLLTEETRVLRDACDLLLRPLITGKIDVSGLDVDTGRGLND